MSETRVRALTSPALQAPGISHAFFTREGGVSTGLYATLNGGVGSKDDPHRVAENRARMAACLGVRADHLLVPYQVHSAAARAIDAPFAERPRCDGLVTMAPGLALAVTGADCGIILFADPGARVIGAAHAGWKGAFTGILEATLAAMEGLGARRAAITAVLGPTIGPLSYEVGPEFRTRFVEARADYATFFAPGARDGHAMFDLPAFIGFRLTEAGVGRFENLERDTYAEEALFYSFRRATHRKEPDYGRHIAAIALL